MVEQSTIAPRIVREIEVVRRQKPEKETGTMTSETKRTSPPSTESATILPSTKQVWVHSLDTVAALEDALREDSGITALETDVVMGLCTRDQRRQPILTHPPSRESDLSVAHFLDLVTRPTVDNDKNDSDRRLRKIVKLDFKEMTTVDPTLQEIARLQIQGSLDSSRNVIFLNADILPGPGRRHPSDVGMDCRRFMDTCLQYIGSQSPSLSSIYAFSLGWKTDFTDFVGYTNGDITAMSALISEHKLVESKIGIVLAVNARSLVRNMSPFDGIMSEFPLLQILAWTGKGEPQIPRSVIKSIEDHFEARGCLDRVGFDCQIAESYVTSVGAEFAAMVYSYWKWVGRLSKGGWGG